METVVCIVLTILIPLLASNVLRWLMPAECYVWFRARNRMLEQLLGLGVTTVIIFWGLIAGVMVWSLFTSSWEMWETICILLFAAALPVGLLAAKLLMKIFWKPTPEMLAFNDELMKAEMEKAAAAPKPKTKVGESGIHEKLLSPLYPVKIRKCDGCAGGDAGGQTGVAGLVPQRDTRLAGHGADVCLGNAALAKGGDHSQLPQGDHAGAVPGIIGGVAAVRHQGKAVSHGPGCYESEEGLFAVVAAVMGIGGHLREGQNVKVDNRQLCPELLRRCPGVCQLKGGLKGGADKVGAGPLGVLKSLVEKPG